MELVLTLCLSLVLLGILWLLDETAENTEPNLKEKQDLFLEKLVDEIEYRARVCNTEAHQSPLAALVKDEAEVVNQI